MNKKEGFSLRKSARNAVNIYVAPLCAAAFLLSSGSLHAAGSADAPISSADQVKNIPSLPPVMAEATQEPISALPPLPPLDDKGDSGTAMQELFPELPPLPNAPEPAPSPKDIFSLEDIPMAPPQPETEEKKESSSTAAIPGEGKNTKDEKTEETQGAEGEAGEALADGDKKTEESTEGDAESAPVKKAEKETPPDPLPNYRTERLPTGVYRKDYSRENRHLPKAYYESEYVNGLFAAVDRGDVNAIQAFLTADVPLEAVNERGETPFLYAVRIGNLFSVQVLLAKGANPDAVDAQGRNAMHVAVAQKRPDIVEAVLSYNNRLLERPDAMGATPFVLAASVGCVSCMDVLARYGAAIAVPNAEGRTALHAAARGGQVEAINYLIAHGLNVNTADKYGRTPLHYAARFGQAAAASALVRAGAATDIRDAQGYTAEALATASGFREVSGTIIAEAFRRGMMNGAPMAPVQGYSPAAGAMQPLVAPR